jgi:hypothetical protein
VDKKQWDKVEQRLIMYYCSIKMKVDEYELCLMLIPDKGLKQSIVVLVNNAIKLEWVDNDCEIRRRFYNRHTKSLLKANDLRKVPKQMQKEVKEANTYEWYSPYWTSFNKLKNHLIKNNTDIELITNL